VFEKTGINRQAELVGTFSQSIVTPPIGRWTISQRLHRSVDDDDDGEYYGHRVA
jgi:hypothetical protein